LEKNKVKVREIEEGMEFGMMIESKIEIVEGHLPLFQQRIRELIQGLEAIKKKRRIG